MQTKKKVLVTGAAGFIGSHLVRRLINEGYDVIIQKRKGTDIHRIEDIIQDVQVLEFDVRDYSSVNAAIEQSKPDVVIHLVTYYAVNHDSSDVEDMVDTNVKGMINILEACRKTSVKRVVNTSTCFVYRSCNRPLVEDDYLEASNLYALTKIQAEQACSFFAEEYGMQILTLRLFPPYGPSDNPRRLLPYVIKTLKEGGSPRLTSGSQKWDFVYVEDIADAYVKAIEGPIKVAGHEAINIGTGQPTSVKEAVGVVHEIMGSEVSLEWGGVPHRSNEIWFNSADASKAARLLGWKPRTCLRDGLSKTVDWFVQD